MLTFWNMTVKLNQQWFSCDGENYCIVFRQWNHLLLFFPCLISPSSHYHILDCCWELQEPSLLWTLWINSTCHLSRPLPLFLLLGMSQRSDVSRLRCFPVLPLYYTSAYTHTHMYYTHTCIFGQHRSQLLLCKHWFHFNQSNQRGGHYYT